MYLLIGFILIALIYLYISNRTKNSNQSKFKRTQENLGGTSFLPPIPAGYQIFSDGLQVAGIQFRKDDAIKFARSKNQELSLQKDPGNEFDQNAIKLIGLSGSNQYFIGYLPKDISAQIIGVGLFENVRARLIRIYLGKNDFLDIQYQLIGQKKDKKQFDEFLINQAASLLQKDYLRFFGLSVPKGVTYGEAEQIISDHKISSEEEIQDEWESYLDILEELDDKDSREIYDLKKVSKVVLLEAIKQLQAEGKSCKYLANHMDDVAAKIIELKPELERKT